MSTARPSRTRHPAAERARTQEDLITAQALLSRLREQVGPRLPVHAAIPTPLHDQPSTPTAQHEGRAIRIPPIARPADETQPDAFDRALDRLLDDLLAEPDPDPAIDRRSRRAG